MHTNNMQTLWKLLALALILQLYCKNALLVTSQLVRSSSTKSPRVYFTNFKCQSLNKNYAEIEICRLHAVRRDLKEMTLKVKVLQPPVDNVTVRMQFMKKSNGYKPYMVDLTFDGCSFLRGQQNPLLKFLYGILKPYTNINHSCPYNHDVIVEGLRIDSNVPPFATILPSGDYAFFTTWMTNKIKRVFLQLYIRYEEN